MLLRPHLADIKTYEPVEPPERLAERAGIAADQIIKLDANENPYGASPKVARALASLQVHIYPDPLQQRVREALAGYTGMDMEQIVAGAGSDELIDLLLRLFVAPGETVIDCEPTFGMYAFSARVAGAKITLVPRDDAFEIDVEAVRRAVDSRAKVIFISSPNNPTGNVATTARVRALLEAGLIVVVDEAYHEFCGETVAGMVADHENLVVLRTMSKWAGLAGLRIGYGIMSPVLVRHIIDVKPPYNVSTAAEAALLASLEDSESLLEKVGLIVGERGRMFSLLSDIDGVKPWPSGGNFILCQLEGGRAGDVYDGLAGRGIFVRRFSSERLSDFLRITVATPAQTDAVVRGVGELMSA